MGIHCCRRSGPRTTSLETTAMKTTTILLCVSVMTAVAVPTANLFQPHQAQNTNFGLGSLAPQTQPVDEDFSAIMLDLLPEFTNVLKNFGGAQGAQLSVTEAVSVFFPIVRKALEAKATSEGRTLTNAEERLLSLSETSIKLSTGVIESLSVNSSASDIISNVMTIARPIMEANAASQDRTLTQKEVEGISQLEGGVTFTIQAMNDVANDQSITGLIASNLRIARYAMEARAKSQFRTLSIEEENSLNQVEDAINTSVEIMQDFNKLGSNVVEFVPTFMRLSKFLFEARAKNESRLVSWEEEEQLRYTERTLTSALGFVQEIVSGTASEESLNNFMTTTRKLFEQRAINQGRSSLDTNVENNLKLTERALNFAMSTIREMRPSTQFAQIQPISFVQPQMLHNPNSPALFYYVLQNQ